MTYFWEGFAFSEQYVKDQKLFLTERDVSWWNQKSLEGYRKTWSTKINKLWVYARTW